MSATPAAAGSGCQMLAWDSQFFGVRIARATAERIDDESAAGMLAWCRAQAVACLYFLADASHSPTIRAAEQAGFSLVDIRLTLQADLASLPPIPAETQAGISPAQASDLDALKAIARVSHYDSRFYHDPGFEREACERLYQTWIEKSCADPTGTVLVARYAGQVAGYMACRHQDAHTGHIALVAVAPSFRRQGIGQALASAGLAWFRQQQLQSITVVTQGRNLAALRFYQRCGFTSQQLQLWYHLWFDIH